MKNNLINQGNNNINEDKSNEYLIDYKEYYLIKENTVNKFIIEKRKSEIIIKSKNYQKILDLKELSIITKSILNTIDDGYQFIINTFEENKVTIKNIIINQSINLLLKIYIYNKESDVEMSLEFNKENKDIIIHELNQNYNELKKDINNLKDEIKTLTEEISKLKSLNSNANSQYNKNISILKEENDKLKLLINNTNIQYNEEINILKEEIDKLKNDNINTQDNEELITNNNNINNVNQNSKDDFKFMKDLSIDSYSDNYSDNTFTVFKSISDIFYFIYTNKNKSILFYNLIDNKKINEIKNAHNEVITNFKHYLDNINKIDIVMSISMLDNNIKLWNINDIECLLSIKYIYTTGNISACFIKENDQDYIVTSNSNYPSNPEPIKVFDFYGNQKKEIKYSNDNAFVIESYYDQKLSNNYIITGNRGYVKSYDFDKNKKYKKYYDNDNKCHKSIIIYNCNDIVKMVESSYDGNIRLWNFHTGELLNRINICDNALYGICLWNDEYLFVGCEDKEIKLIDLSKGIITKNLIGHISEVLTLKKIFIPQIGNILISQGWHEDKIKLWINKS